MSLLGACSEAGSRPTNSPATSAGAAAVAAGAQAPSTAGATPAANGGAGAPSVPGQSGRGGSESAGAPAAGAPGSNGSAAQADDAGASDASGSAGADSAMPSGPTDYGARGRHEITIEKNVGESHRNTSLTDDTARCASLVAGLGDDADSGDWAIYPEDMDRQLYTLYRPTQLEEGVTYPVITWGNGTCSQPLSFEPLLSHLASHGFIVIASNWRWVASGAEMRRALDFVLAENMRPGSVLFGKIAADKLGASGHSQGSSATVTVGADERIVATVPIQGASAAGVRRLAGPTFLIAGENDMAVSPSSIESAFGAATVPAVYGLSLGHDHIMPVVMPQPILGAVTAWFALHLRGEQQARPIFYDECTLCKDPTWRVRTANL